MLMNSCCRDVHRGEEEEEQCSSDRSLLSSLGSISAGLSLFI
jgi:hypothetical protein